MRNIEITELFQEIPAEQKSWYMLIASVDNKPVGNCEIAGLKTESLQIQTLHVEVYSRGFGVGTKLINHVISLAKQHNKKSISLCVAKKNELAVKLYERLGFVMYLHDAEDNYWMGYSIK